MQIREIHIDGFGNFFDRKISGFESGLNIIYGENESGKTTIFEFIRRTMFGFNVKKVKSFKNNYPPLRGGAFGGKITCLASNGKYFIISRTGTPGGKNSQVSVLADSKELSGQAHLNEFLGHASEEIYKNVYAFTLDELQDFGLLKDDEIKNKIYGAGLGLGKVSLAEVKTNFEKYSDGLFKPNGKNPSINSIWSEIKNLEQKISYIQSNSDQFAELNEAVTRLNAEQTELESQIEKLEINDRLLLLQKDLYPTYIDLSAGEKEIGSIETVDNFPDSAMDDFNSIKSKSNACEVSIQNELGAREKLRAQYDGLEVNEALLEKETDVMALMQMTDKVRSAMHDIIVLNQERDSLVESIKIQIKRISNDWDEGRVTSFELTEAERNQTTNFEEKFNVTRQNKNSAEDKLDLHREQKAAEYSSGWDVPPWCKYATIILTVGGILGSALGAVKSNIPLLAFSIGVFLLGGLFFWFILKDNNGFRRKDILESALVEKLQQAVKEENQVLAEWQLWLADHNMDESLIPSALEKVVAIIDKVKTMLAERTKLDQRMARMMDAENNAKALAKEIAVYLPNIPPDASITAVIELIGKYLEDAKRFRNQRRVIESNIEVQNNRIMSLENQKKGLDAHREELFRKAGADDEESFLQKNSIFEKHILLRNSIAENRKHIQARVGVDEEYENFIKSLESISPVDLENKSVQISSKLQALKENRKELNQAIGENRNKINQLISNDELLILQSELEMKKEELNNLSREWAVSRLALHMLDKGKQEYEKNRQPGVIKTASEYFSLITPYRNIIKPLDSDDILISDHGENRKGVAEMSRGTREQLYLAMRFGLIKEYETRSEPLPVVMDDVFVNFDDDRRERVIKILKEFSVGRQVIILSCHQHSLDLYIRHGASQVHIK